MKVILITVCMASICIHSVLESIRAQNRQVCAILLHPLSVPRKSRSPPEICSSNIVDLTCPLHSPWQVILSASKPVHIHDLSLGVQQYVFPNFQAASTDISSAGAAMSSVMRGTRHVLCARIRVYRALATRRMFSLMQRIPTAEFAFDDPH